MKTKNRRRMLWAAAALVGAILGVLLVPGWIEKRQTPERLRSRDEAERTERAASQSEEPASPSLRYETKGIKVTFRPVEGETQEEESVPSARPRMEHYSAPAEGADAVH